MLENELRTSELPVIPDKRYFTIGEVSELCRVKTHVLRYWEQEFRQLNPVRRGNRRYYRRNDVILIRQIRNLLYDQRFTIDGARCQLEGRKKTQEYDIKHYQQIIRQIIAGLEDVLDTLDGIPTSSLSGQRQE
ncbi:MerR family transcriptional regulator [Endozoicomonas sp. Mp262]|uniref:MerR family transcriptional regulator n=1 Tax=Endozoicomonas sp. Mp262 TaxID=2919499 RepID=UPI0021D89EAD